MNWCHVLDVVRLSPTGSWDKTPIRNIVMDGGKDRRMGGWMALDFGFKVLLWRNCGYEFFFRFMEIHKHKCSHLPEKFYHLWDRVTHPRSFASHLSFRYGVPVPAVPLSFSCSVSSSSGSCCAVSEKLLLWHQKRWSYDQIMGWAPDQQLCKDRPNQYENIKWQYRVLCSFCPARWRCLNSKESTWLLWDGSLHFSCRMVQYPNREKKKF